MASPTEAEIQTMISNAVKYLDESHRFANVTVTNNIVSMEDVLTQSLESDWADSVTAVLFSTRQNFGSILNSAANLLAPLLLTYGKFMNIPETNVQLIIDRLYTRFIGNSLSVNSRNITFATPAAGANVGNGTILRLNTDERNHPIEAQTIEAKRAECVLDENSGADKHEEIFEFRGAQGGRDILERENGSGSRRRIKALSARDSLLLNPSFSDFTDVIGGPNDITNWTSSVAVVGDGTDYTIDQTNTYRDFAGDTTPSALNIKLTRNLTQRLSVRGTQLDPDVPYMLQVAYNRQVGAASGTLLIRMGAVSNSVAVAAQTGWNLLRVVATPGQNNWLLNFNEANLDIVIEWTRTGGELLIDDVLFIPATGFDGSWYWIIGGSTKFRINDVFTWTDTEGGAKIQRWFWRAFNRYLPSNNVGLETWVDPA